MYGKYCAWHRLRLIDGSYYYYYNCFSAKWAGFESGDLGPHVYGRGGETVPGGPYQARHSIYCAPFYSQESPREGVPPPALSDRCPRRRGSVIRSSPVLFLSGNPPLEDYTDFRLVRSWKTSS